MNWRIRRCWLVIVAACLLSAPAARAQEPQEPPTVDEIRKKIQDQEKQAEEEKDDADEAAEDDSGECSLFWELFSEIFKVLFVYAATVRYPEYPYAADADYPFGSQSMDQAMGEYLRIGYVNLSVEGATLREDRWGLSGRLAVTILPIHLHGFSQVLLDPTGSITVYAVNGGITLPFRRLILNLFAGVFGTDLFSRALFSYGAQAQLFFPARLIVEAYLLNASYQPLRFNFLSLSLSFAVNRANLGLGFSLNRYGETLLMGPLARVALWF